jgi:hypothetical protein
MSHLQFSKTPLWHGMTRTNYTPVRDVEFCEICHLPLFLNPSDTDKAVCNDCVDLLMVRGELWRPCRRCGRRHEFQFSCNKCGAHVCDGCVYAEHEGECLEDD